MADDGAESRTDRARVAVVMAAYNAEKTLRGSVESLVASSVPVDVIVVDDGSRIPAAGVVAGLGARVRVIRMDRNVGQSAALNHGIRVALEQGYDYIGRLDADDLATPDRFALQIPFLDTHPDVGVVGSRMRVCDEDTLEPIYVEQAPLDDRAIRERMFFNNAMAHPSLLFRAAVFRDIGGYDGGVDTAEDYELLRRVHRHWRLANLPEILLVYRLSRGGKSMKKRRRQLIDRLRVQVRYFAPFEWRAWAGVAQTLALTLVPVDLLIRLKARLSPAKPS